jgi:adenylate kinase family enzyme
MKPTADITPDDITPGTNLRVSMVIAVSIGSALVSGGIVYGAMRENISQSKVRTEQLASESISRDHQIIIDSISRDTVQDRRLERLEETTDKAVRLLERIDERTLEIKRSVTARP